MGDWAAQFAPSDEAMADGSPFGEHRFRPTVYQGPLIPKSYNTPHALSEEQKQQFGTAGYQPSVKTAWMTPAGFNDWKTRNKKSGYTHKYEDIDRDHVPDMVVYDAEGRPIAVNGAMLKPSKLPHYYLHDDLLGRQAAGRIAWNGQYKANIADLKKKFKEIIKPIYQAVVATYGVEHQAIVKQFTPLVLVANELLKADIMDTLDAKIGEKYAADLQKLVPAQRLAKLHSLAVYKGALANAIDAYEGAHTAEAVSQKVAATITGLSNGEMAAELPDAYAQFRGAAVGRHPAKIPRAAYKGRAYQLSDRALYDEWMKLSPATRDALQWVARQQPQDRDGAIAVVAERLGQPVADGVRALIPLGVRAVAAIDAAAGGQ